jgi:DNA-binding SARP family transcriptional activator
LPARIQLCGRFTVEFDGERVEEALPGRQGRLLFARLAVARNRTLTRTELEGALWPDSPPAAADVALRALVSKLRAAVGERLQGRGDLRLALEPGAWVDVLAAEKAIHLAESAVAREAWAEAWPEAHIALNISRRVFMAGHEAPWIEERRRALSEIRLRGLECWAATGLGLGGAELRDAEAAARTLCAEAPFRESGHALLMRVLAARGNTAEALRVYEELRCRLRDELGLAPGEELRRLHEATLR